MEREQKNKTQLSEEARQRRNEYLRKWRKNHKTQCAEYARRYWEKRTAGECGAGEAEG